MVWPPTQATTSIDSSCSSSNIANGTNHGCVTAAHKTSPTGAVVDQLTMQSSLSLLGDAGNSSTLTNAGSITSNRPLSERRTSVSSSTTGDSGVGSILSNVFIDQRGIKCFENNHDYLYAMTEDLAEWFNCLYNRNITVDSFFEEIETGLLLCKHAQEVQKAAQDFFQTVELVAGCQPQQKQRTFNLRVGNRLLQLPDAAPRYRANARAATFLARDNVANFISWIRAFGVPECLLFETDDLVERKNCRNVILCLLEVARIGARFGMEVPDLVHLEEEIDAELGLLNSSTASLESVTQLDMMKDIGSSSSACSSMVAKDVVPLESKQVRQTPPKVLPTPRRKERPKCDMRSLDERIRDMLAECKCEEMFPMRRLSEGKYMFGDNSTLIFVRILRNHVMVRVGGGWDTLEHLLQKHDTCRHKKDNGYQSNGFSGSQGPTKSSQDSTEFNENITSSKLMSNATLTNRKSEKDVLCDASSHELNLVNCTTTTTTTTITTTTVEPTPSKETPSICSGASLRRRNSFQCSSKFCDNKIESGSQLDQVEKLKSRDQKTLTKEHSHSSSVSLETHRAQIAPIKTFQTPLRRRSSLQYGSYNTSAARNMARPLLRQAMGFEPPEHSGTEVGVRHHIAKPKAVNVDRPSCVSRIPRPFGAQTSEKRE